MLRGLKDGVSYRTDMLGCHMYGVGGHSGMLGGH